MKLTPILIVLVIGLSVALAVVAGRLPTDTQNRDVDRLAQENRQLQEQIRSLEAELGRRSPDAITVEQALEDLADEMAADEDMLPDLDFDLEEAMTSEQDAGTGNRPPVELPTTATGWIELLIETAESGDERAMKRLHRQVTEWIKADPSRIPEVIEAMKGIDDPKFANALAEGLVKYAVGNEEAQRAMLKLLTDPDATLEAKAGILNAFRTTLRKDPLAAGRLTDEDRRMLNDLAVNGDSALRSGAIGVLARIADDPQAQNAFLTTWNDPNLDASGRRHTMEGLRYAEESTATPILLDALVNDEDVRVRREAAASLMYLAPTTSTDDVFRTVEPMLYGETDWRVKGVSAAALVRLDDQRALSVLRNMQTQATDPWEAKKIKALADLVETENDFIKVMREGRQAIRVIEAQQREAESTDAR
jgi:HEAT repeat protein